MMLILLDIVEFSFNKLQELVQNMIFDIYLKLFKVLILLKRHDELLTYAMAATVLPLVYERNDWNKSINFTGLIACILKSDGKNAFNILRNFIIEVDFIIFNNVLFCIDESINSFLFFVCQKV